MLLKSRLFPNIYKNNIIPSITSYVLVKTPFHLSPLSFASKTKTINSLYLREVNSSILNLCLFLFSQKFLILTSAQLIFSTRLKHFGALISDLLTQIFLLTTVSTSMAGWLSLSVQMPLLSALPIISDNHYFGSPGLKIRFNLDNDEGTITIKLALYKYRFLCGGRLNRNLLLLETLIMEWERSFCLKSNKYFSLLSHGCWKKVVPICRLSTPCVK